MNPSLSDNKGHSLFLNARKPLHGRWQGLGRGNSIFNIKMVRDTMCGTKMVWVGTTGTSSNLGSFSTYTPYIFQ